MSRIMMVASNCAELVPSSRHLGVSLQQLGSVSDSFARFGWDVVVASPAGGRVPLDAGTLSEEWIGAATLAEDTRCLHDLDAADADAWFVLGGHGVLGDLVDDKALQRLLTDATESGRLVAAVDHGSAVLAGLVRSDGSRLLSGAYVTGRTDVEERDIRQLGIARQSTEQLLRSAGARFSHRAPWQAHVVVDRNIITGQNPASTEGTVSAVVHLTDGLAQAA